PFFPVRLPPPCSIRLSLAPAEDNTGRRFEPCCSFAEEVRQGAPTNVHAEAHGPRDVEEFNTATIVHREESIATSCIFLSRHASLDPINAVGFETLSVIHRVRPDKAGVRADLSAWGEYR